MTLCFVGETMLVLGSGVVIQVQMTIWLSQINMRYKSDRRAQWKTYEDIWRFSLLLQLQSSTIRYFNLFMLNSFVAIWPFGGLSSFDLPSRTFWDPITYTPFQLKLEAETLGGGYFFGYILEMIMEAMLDFPGHTGIPHGMTCFFCGKLSTKESPYPPFRYFLEDMMPMPARSHHRLQVRMSTTQHGKGEGGRRQRTKKKQRKREQRWMTILLRRSIRNTQIYHFFNGFYIIKHLVP